METRYIISIKERIGINKKTKEEEFVYIEDYGVPGKESYNGKLVSVRFHDGWVIYKKEKIERFIEKGSWKRILI